MQNDHNTVSLSNKQKKYFLRAQVLLEKLKGSTPKLCDSLVVGDVDTSAQLTTGTDSGISSGITSLGEGREGSRVTSQGKYSLAFHQVGEFPFNFCLCNK